MAVTVNPGKTKLVMRYMVGTSPSGFPIIRQKSLPGVRATVSDQDLYDTATVLFSLLEYPLVEVLRDGNDDVI